MAKKQTKKQPQILRGCYFPEHAIPDTFSEFKELYKDYAIYKDLKGAKLTEALKRDFEKLSGENGHDV